MNSSRLEDSDAEVMAGDPARSSRSGDWKLPCDIPRVLNRLLEECVDVLEGEVDREIQNLLLPKIRQIYQIGSEASHAVSRMAETVERLQDEKELLETARQSLVGTLEQLEDREHNSTSAWKRKFEKAMEELEIAENIIDNLQTAAIKTPRTPAEVIENVPTDNQSSLIEDLRTRLNRKDEECERLSAEYQEIIAQLELRQRQMLADAENSKEILERENESLLSAQANYEQEVDMLRAALAEMEEKCSKMEKENEALEQELRDLMSRVTDILIRNNLSTGDELKDIHNNPGDYIAQAMQCLASMVKVEPPVSKVELFPSQLSQDLTKKPEIHYHFHYHGHQHEHTHMHKHNHQHLYGQASPPPTKVATGASVIHTQSVQDEEAGKISARVCAA